MVTFHSLTDGRRHRDRPGRIELADRLTVRRGRFVRADRRARTALHCTALAGVADWTEWWLAGLGGWGDEMRGALLCCVRVGLCVCRGDVPTTVEGV